MHHLSVLAVRRPVAITVIILVILLFGVISVQRIGVDLLPEFNLPVAAIVTAYPSAQAEMVEQEITIPIENALASVSGITRVDSYSMENVSAIIIQMEWNTNMLEALDIVRSSLAQVAFQLPSDAQPPVVARIDPNESPLMIVGVSADTLTDLELATKLKRLRPQLEQIQGVAEVGLLGARQEEIQVLFEPESLDQMNLSVAILEQLINFQNLIVPGGSVTDDERRYNLRTGNRITSVEELGDLVIGQKASNGILNFGGLIPSVIRLSDVAAIDQVVQVQHGITRLNGSDTVLLRIMRQSGANTVQIASQVHKTLAELGKEHPELTFIPLLDQSSFIVHSITGLIFNGFIGALLALLVLYFFLRNVRSLLVISVAIPISIIASFIMVYFGNLSLNLMTLGGLALGAGMLVDSSIVVLENIYRHRIEGKDPILAAEFGSKEIASAIIASTTTTLAVFLPVVYMQSIAGELFKELGLTVSFSLLASLFVALTVVPMLTARVFTIKSETIGSGYSPKFRKFQAWYEAQLRNAIGHRGIVMGLVLVTLVIAATIYPLLGEEFLPIMDENTIGVQLVLPAGIPINRTKQMLIDLEQDLLNVPEIQAMTTQAGNQGASDLVSQIYGADLYSADLQISLKPKNARSRSSWEISNEIREIALHHNVIRVNLLGSSLFGSAAALLTPQLLIEVRGEQWDKLNAILDEVIAKLAANPGYTQIESSQTQVIHDLFLQVQPARSILGGLTAGQVGLAVRQATMGIKATDIYIDGTSMPVVLRPTGEPNTFAGLLDSSIVSPIPINGLGDKPVRLEQIVEAQIQPASPSIQRTNRRRVMNIIGQLDANTDLSTAAREATQVISEIDLPPGYTVEIGGLYQVIDDSKQDMFLALGLAVLLVYLVMAAQFESFLYPLCIMCSVPLAGIGALLALWITGLKISVTALIGVIILAGIVVNNAIVLVDYINLQRRRGLTVNEAVIRACMVRVRPILMTAATTVLGLLPMAFGLGEGSEITIPLAVTVIGGLLSSTILTLFVIPVIYTFTAQLFHGHQAKNLVATTLEEN